jgi:hypothetical protein
LVIAWLIIGLVYLIWRIVQREPIDLDYAFRDTGEAIPPEALATEPQVE